MYFQYIQWWIKARLQRMRYLRLREEIIRRQRAAEADLALRTVAVIKAQAFVRGWLVRRRVQRMHSAATYFQVIIFIFQFYLPTFSYFDITSHTR